MILTSGVTISSARRKTRLGIWTLFSNKTIPRPKSLFHLKMTYKWLFRVKEKTFNLQPLTLTGPRISLLNTLFQGTLKLLEILKIFVKTRCNVLTFVLLMGTV